MQNVKLYQPAYVIKQRYQQSKQPLVKLLKKDSKYALKLLNDQMTGTRMSQDSSMDNGQLMHPY